MLCFKGNILIKKLSSLTLRQFIIRRNAGDNALGTSLAQFQTTGFQKLLDTGSKKRNLLLNILCNFQFQIVKVNITTMNAANLLTRSLTPDTAIHTDSTKQARGLTNAASTNLAVTDTNHTTVVAIVRTVIHNGIGNKDVTVNGILIATPVAESTAGNKLRQHFQIPTIINRSILVGHERTARSILISTQTKLLVAINSTQGIVTNDSHSISIVDIKSFNIPHLTQERGRWNIGTDAELLNSMIGWAKLATVIQLKEKVIVFAHARNTLTFDKNILAVLDRNMGGLHNLFVGLGLRPPILMNMRTLVETGAGSTLKGANKIALRNIGLNLQLFVTHLKTPSSGN